MLDLGSWKKMRLKRDYNLLSWRLSRSQTVVSLTWFEERGKGKKGRLSSEDKTLGGMKAGSNELGTVM